LIFGLLVAFLAAVYLRIILEVVAVLFAIHYDIRALSGRAGQQSPTTYPGGGASVPPTRPAQGAP
jgi:hypothetical protein